MTINAEGNQTEKVYDNAGRVIAIVNEEDKRTTLTYDQVDRRLSVENPLNQIQSSTYDEAGRLLRQTPPRGDYTDFVYDLVDRLLTKLFSYDGSSTTFAYDAVGNRTTLTASGSDGFLWKYDKTNQLLVEKRTLSSDSYTNTLTYDPRGNRQTLDGVDDFSYDYNDANRLETITDVSGITTYTYDDNGNQRTIEEPNGDITTNTWNGENRLILVEHPDSTETTYRYNGDGLRVFQEHDGTVTLFLYDGNNLLQETDDTGLVEAAFTYIPLPYAEVLSQRRDTESSFYLPDGIRNIRQLTDDMQLVTDEYAFDAFGNLRSATGSTANSQLYKGQLLSYRNDPHAGPDTQTSMHFRNQSATTFRFTSEDPAEDDLNLYRPVGNNPVNGEDPSGLEENPGRQKLFREIIERMEGDRQRFSTVQMQRALTVLYKSAYTTPTPRAQKDIDAVSSTSAIDQYWYIVTLQSLDYQEKFAANEAAFRHYQHDRDSGSSRLLGRRMPEWAQSWDMVQGQFYKESREQLSKDVDTLLNTLDLVTFVGAVAKAELSALKLARAEARAARTIEVLPDIVSDGATSFEALSIRPGKPTQLNVDVFDLGSPVYTAETPKAIVIADGKVVVNPMVLKTEVGVWVPGMGGFDRLPGEIGRKIPRDLTDTQAQFLIESYPVEFGVSENQVTGEFRLHSGTINSIRIAPHEGFQQGDLWWLNHTHPGGGPAASTRDMAYLKFLQGEQLKAGHSAQPSSRIFPWRGESFEFTPYNPRLEK